MNQINTERLQLRFPLTEADPRHIEWLNDQSLMRWSEQRYHEHTPNTQRRFLDQALMDHDPICFDIRLPGESFTLDESVSIGTIHAYIDKRHRRADLGILLGPQYHGKGYAREAWSAVERHLHQEHSISKFEAGCVSSNRPMYTLLEKLGYEFEGQRLDHFLIDGVPYALLLYGKLMP